MLRTVSGRLGISRAAAGRLLVSGTGVVIFGLGRAVVLGFATRLAFAEAAQHLLGLHGVAFFHQHLAQRAGLGCHDLEHHLVGLDLDDQLVALDAITRLLVPSSHAALGNGFRKGGCLDLGSHVVSLMCSLSSRWFASEVEGVFHQLALLFGMHGHVARRRGCGSRATGELESSAQSRLQSFDCSPHVMLAGIPGAWFSGSSWHHTASVTLV